MSYESKEKAGFKFKDLLKSVKDGEGENVEIVDGKIVVDWKDNKVWFTEPLEIRRPLTLKNLVGVMAIDLKKLEKKKYKNKPMIIVKEEGVTLEGLDLRGNRNEIIKNKKYMSDGKIHQKYREPLIEIQKERFKVLDCFFRNGSKDGVMVNSDGGGTITGENIMGRSYPKNTLEEYVLLDELKKMDNVNLIWKIKARNMEIDGVSLSGGGIKGQHVQNVLVYDVDLRNDDDPSLEGGAVEVSDGAQNIQVWKAYAEDAKYAVDVQDHEEGEANVNIKLVDIEAKDCTHVVKTANHSRTNYDPEDNTEDHDLNHEILVIHDVKGTDCIIPIEIKNTKDVTIENLEIIDNKIDKKDFKSQRIRFEDCDGVTIRGLTINTDKKYKLKEPFRLKGKNGLRLEKNGEDNIIKRLTDHKGKKVREAKEIADMSPKQEIKGLDTIKVNP